MSVNWYGKIIASAVAIAVTLVPWQVAAEISNAARSKALTFSIEEADVNALLDSLVAVRALGFARYNGGLGLESYAVYLSQAAVDLSSANENEVRYLIRVSARADFDLQIFDIDLEWDSPWLSLLARVDVEQEGASGGYQLILQPFTYELPVTPEDSFVQLFGAVAAFSGNRLDRKIVISSFGELYPDLPKQYMEILEPTVSIFDGKINVGWTVKEAPPVSHSNVILQPLLLQAVGQYGDFNGDDCIDLEDLYIIVEDVQSPGANNSFYDINNDGEVNIHDVRALALLFSVPGGGPCN